MTRDVVAAAVPRKVAVWLRVSTAEQKLDSQSAEIEQYVRARDWRVVARYEEAGVSGAAVHRQVVDEILGAAQRRKFEAVVVWRGDRAFRGAARGCMFIDSLLAHGVHFVAIQDGIDTATPAGEVMAKMSQVFAEWERAGIRARVRAGIAAARARGTHLGRPRCSIDIARAQAMLAAGSSRKATARALGVSPRTLGRALQAAAETSLRAGGLVVGESGTYEGPLEGGER